MLPLQSKLLHTELHSRVVVAPRAVARCLARWRPRAGAIARRGAVACWLFACESCSFDAEPQSGGRKGIGTDPAWTPRSASDAGVDAAVSDPPVAGMFGRPASSSRDAGMSARAGEGGRPARPVTNARSMSTPAGPAARDQSDAAPASDAGQAVRDAGRPPLQDTPGSASPQRSDAAIVEEDASTAQQDAAQLHADCKPGLYQGIFTGSVELIGLSLSSVTGTVRTALTLDASGRRLQINEGLVVGIDQEGNSLAVDLSGSINCATNQVEGGRLENGIFHIGASDTNIAFIGTVQAEYSRDPFSVAGMWTVEALDTASLLTGRGTWSLVLSD